MNNEHYPIEVIHWAGMTDECLPDLKQLLEKYPDYINTKNGYNDNALIVAARTGNADIVKYLMEETKIEQDIVVNEGNALTVACKYNRKNVISYLLTTNISIECADDAGWTPLFYIAKYGHDDILELLQNKNVNYSHLDSEKQNVLFSFVNGYVLHRNYYAFEMLEMNLSDKTLFFKNNVGQDIISYMEYLIEQSQNDNNIIRTNRMIELYSPLFSILKSRKFDSNL